MANFTGVTGRSLMLVPSVLGVLKIMTAALPEPRKCNSYVHLSLCRQDNGYQFEASLSGRYEQGILYIDSSSVHLLSHTDTYKDMNLRRKTTCNSRFSPFQNYSHVLPLPTLLWYNLLNSLLTPHISLVTLKYHLYIVNSTFTIHTYTSTTSFALQKGCRM